MSKNKKIIVTVIILSIIIFIGSYLLYINNQNNKQYKKISKNSDMVMSNMKFNNTVNKDTKFTFVTNYSKSGQKQSVKKIAGIDYKELIGYDREKLSKKFLDEGYEIENMNNSEVTFVRKLDRYFPNKYVIGLEKIDNQEYIAIFKTDKEGNMYIEDYANDITNIKAEILRTGDLEILRHGDKELQFEDKNSAKIFLTQYES